LQRSHYLVNSTDHEEVRSWERIQVAGDTLQQLSVDLIDLRKREATEKKVLAMKGKFKAAEREFLTAINIALQHEEQQFATSRTQLDCTLTAAAKNIGLTSGLIVVSASSSLVGAIHELPLLRFHNKSTGADYRGLADHFLKVQLCFPFARQKMLHRRPTACEPLGSLVASTADQDRGDELYSPGNVKGTLYDRSLTSSGQSSGVGRR
jgi:hypothetical protein